MNKIWKSNIYEIQALLYILVGMVAIKWFDEFWIRFLAQFSIGWGFVTLIVAVKYAFEWKRRYKNGKRKN